MNPEASTSNERLRRARNLKGWSQAELAEKVGTSFEMVSRWERGITLPGPHYRRRLCEVLEQSAEELGLLRDLRNPLTTPSAPVQAAASEQTDVSAELSLSMLQPEQSAEVPPPQHVASEQLAQIPPSQLIAEALSPPSQSLPPTNGTKPLTHPLPPLSLPTSHTRGSSLIRMPLVISIVIVLIAGSILGSFSLLKRFDILGTHNSSPAIAHGGTWVSELDNDPDSLIPNGLIGNGTGTADAASEMDQALYLPLFYGDAQGVIHAGAATEVPTLQNGGVNTNATIWTFHLRPHLVWSDGQPYDARDVDYTWRLWLTPAFSAWNTTGLNLIANADVSPDSLSITFHLKHPFAPFLAEAWVDGTNAPLPAHHFRVMAPASILKSSDNLNPLVTSGPFMISESLPGSHYTVIRNPRYYRASEGLPYLDKVTFLSNSPSDNILLSEVQKGLLDSTSYTRIPGSAGYKDTRVLVLAPPSNAFEALYFNFHNTLLATHVEVRQAIAMAVDQTTLIGTALQGMANPLCTDHPSMYHPGYEPLPPCPLFDLAAANKLLDDNGWRKGADGVRMKEGQRLEFEYSTALSVQKWRLGIESILQSDLQKVGIQLDIQNYPPDVFFGSFLPKASTSPPSGAIAGRYDIAEFANTLTYDPDDSFVFACNQTPPNAGFYCNHQLDALYMQEQATADPGIRQEIFMQIHRIYLTQYPFVVLASPFLTVLSKKGTHNFRPGPFLANTNIWEWWCDNGKC